MPDYATAPDRWMIPAISLYLSKGEPPRGRFLMALLQNDLRGATRAADSRQTIQLREWVLWLEKNLMPRAWGSPAVVEAWCDALEDT